LCETIHTLDSDAARKAETGAEEARTWIRLHIRVVQGWIVDNRPILGDRTIFAWSSALARDVAGTAIKATYSHTADRWHWAWDIGGVPMLDEVPSSIITIRPVAACNTIVPTHASIRDSTIEA